MNGKKLVCGSFRASGTGLRLLNTLDVSRCTQVVLKVTRRAPGLPNTAAAEVSQIC